ASTHAATVAIAIHRTFNVVCVIAKLLSSTKAQVAARNASPTHSQATKTKKPARAKRASYYETGVS
ncbi:MAG: hypothetical protein II058_05425, partial [Rhodocyclaceae bacterium]|nr:hypothetical protein [Rhodocyclaceae bacterium]